VTALVALLVGSGCGSDTTADGAAALDLEIADAAVRDAAVSDLAPLDGAHSADTSRPDASSESGDQGPLDGAAERDAAADGGLGEPCRGAVELDELGLTVADTCGDSLLRLTPGLRTAEAGWWQATAGDCAVAEDELRCAVPDLGALVLRKLDRHSVQLEVEPSRALTVEALGLVGNVRLPGGRAWLSNGFQSWSGAGMIAIGRPPSDETLRAALQARGDLEVARNGSELSWWHTLAGGGESSLLLAALSAERLPTWIAIHRSAPERASVRLVAGDTGERVVLGPAERFAADPWRVELGADPERLQRAWADSLPTRRSNAPRPAAAGWNSWYELWDTVDAEAVRANAELAAELLEPSLPADGGAPWIVIDDGWQQDWGAWVPNAKFPRGVGPLADDLRDMDLRVGLWLAPLLVRADTPLVVEHPDWLLPAEWSFQHMEHGPMRVLDVTHPDAAAHLGQVIDRIRGWGVDLLKIDFLFAGAWNGPRHTPLTGVQAYGEALRIIREAAGEEALLLAVGAPGLPSLPWVDAWRLGGDIAPEQTGPAWAFVANEARSLAARWPLCLATLCDADPVLLRDLARSEVEVQGWVVALAGGALFLSDDLRALPAERRSWVPGPRQASLALGAQPGVPLDPFPLEPPTLLALPLTDHLLGRTTLSVPALWQAADGRLVRLNVLDEPRPVAEQMVPGRAAVAEE